jgi:hypothetical protein
MSNPCKLSDNSSQIDALALWYLLKYVMKKITKISLFMLLTLITLLLTVNFTSSPEIVGTARHAPQHSIWHALLQEHVSPEGWVDYEGMKGSQTQLDAYLTLLSQKTPSGSWSETEKLAYWINAYNAFTVKLIVNNYPINSIKELNPSPYIPLVNSVWTKKFFKLNGRPTNLDEIEHKMLRKQFHEPRIHFAINCASVSCPVLRNEAYTAGKLESQLADQAIRFINNDLRNKITKDHIQISRIFQWFKGDFTKEGNLITFLNKYSEVEIASNAEVDYLKYDWGLNGRGEAGSDKRGGKRDNTP